MNDFAHGVYFVWAEHVHSSLTDNFNTSGTLLEFLFYLDYHGTFHLTFIAIQVKYRDVPGIDTAYLAMDTEEGVEVVWNEAQFSGSKKFKAQVNPLKLVWPMINFRLRSFLLSSLFISQLEVLQSIILDLYFWNRRTSWRMCSRCWRTLIIRTLSTFIGFGPTIEQSTKKLEKRKNQG